MRADVNTDPLDIDGIRPTNAAALAEGFTALPNWIIRETELTRNALLVLLALAGRANASGYCFPSHQTIAREARCSPASVKRAIGELITAGFVSTEHRIRPGDGGYTSNGYAVNLNPSGAVAHSELSPQDGSSPRAIPQLTVSYPPAHSELAEEEPDEEEPGEEHTPSRAAARGVLEAAWTTFWEMYPRHVGKQDAKKAFEKAARTVDPETIVDAAARFASDPNLPEKQFIPHPGTWLRQGRWDDEPLPPRARQLTHRDQTMMGELQWAHDYEQQQRHRLEIEA